MKKRISVTEAARNFADCVNRAHYQNVTFVLLKVVGVFVPLRVSLQQELEGLDISQHGEALQ